MSELLTAKEEWERGRIPWWAVSVWLVQNWRERVLTQKSVEYRAARLYQLGLVTPGRDQRVGPIFQQIVADAVASYGPARPEDLVADAPDVCRQAALLCPRSFCAFADIRDDNLNPMSLSWFHARSLWMLRTRRYACLLLPYAHGKSTLSSFLLPLIDLAEQPEVAHVRIYESASHATYWVRRIMAEIEHNQALHTLFPHIRRPEKGDRTEGIWSTRAFAIGGKTTVEPSYRPLTVGSAITGIRADRVGADDWVHDGNAASTTVQSKMINYFRTGVMTMPRYRPEWDNQSAIRGTYTKWGTVFLIGTIFDRQDVNYRIFEEWSRRAYNPHHFLKINRDYGVLRFSVYPNKDSREKHEVLWPEQRPFEYVQGLERSLGTRAFRMRCENRPEARGKLPFPPSIVKRAVRYDLPYGTRPYAPHSCIIAFDPATGHTTSKAASHPAFITACYTTDHILHIIRYERWDVPQPQQISKLVEYGRHYQCPIVVESNNIQISYRDWISEFDPTIQVIVAPTTRLKHDKATGIESLRALFDEKRIVIHAGGADPATVDDYVNEFIGWPQHPTDDLIMATWMARGHFRAAVRAFDATQPQPPTRPRRWVIDLSAYHGDTATTTAAASGRRRR